MFGFPGVNESALLKTANKYLAIIIEVVHTMTWWKEMNNSSCAVYVFNSLSVWISLAFMISDSREWLLPRVPNNSFKTSESPIAMNAFVYKLTWLRETFFSFPFNRIKINSMKFTACATRSHSKQSDKDHSIIDSMVRILSLDPLLHYFKSNSLQLELLPLGALNFSWGYRLGC